MIVPAMISVTSCRGTMKTVKMQINYTLMFSVIFAINGSQYFYFYILCMKSTYDKASIVIVVPLYCLKTPICQLAHKSVFE
jgi:hypothetical protein